MTELHPPILSMSGIEKAFPGVRALAGAGLVVRPSEVHGLVGENGAGKSTLIKVLAGLYGRDAGTIEIDGEAFPSLTPTEAYRAGVRFVHQELQLVPTLTVAENVFLGIERTGFAGVRTREMRRRAEEVLGDVLGVEIPARRLVRDLGPAGRKLVQIARALVADGAKLIVFDEPTAPLASAEAEHLLTAIGRLRERGIASLYVSHYIGEVTRLCDRVTVFRGGRDVAVLDDVAAESGTEIIRLMVGRDIEQLYPPAREAPVGEPVLVAGGVSSGRAVTDVSLDVGRGEIVGVTGLLGSGASELIEVLVGLRRRSGGTVTLDDRPFHPSSPAQALDRGVALIPRDRRHEGLVLDFSVERNLTLSTLRLDSGFGFLDRRRSRARSEDLIGRLDIRPADPAATAGRLSGGNQQKVVLGRGLAADARVIILDEPTVGVDIGAKEEIYRLLAELAAQGTSIVVASTDPAEIIGLCDRALVLVRGRIVADLPTADLAVEDLIATMTGSADDPRSEGAEGEAA